MTLENQFFLTSKAGATVADPVCNFLAIVGCATMTHLFKCILKTGYCIYYIQASFCDDLETQNEQKHMCDVLVANIKETGYK